MSEIRPLSQAAVDAVFGPSEGAPAPAPVETPPPAPSEPKKPVASVNISAAVKAEKRREEARREEAAKRAEVEALAKDAEAHKALLASGKKDPLAAIKALGFTNVKEFLTTVADHRDPSPEDERVEKLDARTQEALDRAAKLEAELAKRDAEAEANRKANAEAARVAALHREADAFVDLVGSNPARFPTLFEFGPNEVGNAALQIQSNPAIAQEFLSKHGPDPSEEDLATFLEAKAKATKEGRSQWPEKYRTNARGSAPATAAPSLYGPPANRPTQPRTLSDSLASERVSAPVAMDPDEESRMILRKALGR